MNVQPRDRLEMVRSRAAAGWHAVAVAEDLGLDLNRVVRDYMILNFQVDASVAWSKP